MSVENNMKKLPVFFALSILAVVVSACNIPIKPAPTVAPTEPPTVAILPTNTVAAPIPTNTSSAPVENPTTSSGTVIAHFSAGTKVVVSAIHMVNLANGWAVGRAESGIIDHLLHTTDGGTTWKDMTPPESIDSSFDTSIHFFALNDQTVWATISGSQPGPFSGNTNVWFTSDVGSTWKSSVLDVSGIADYYLPGEMSFPDAQHGWILVHVGAGMSHDYVMFFSTMDGGLTWTRLTDPTSTGTFPQVCCKTGLVFPDSTHGWLTGDTHAVEPGIFFFQSTDAGVTWNEVSLPGPTENPGIFNSQNFGCGTYSPSFIDAKTGSFLVECTNYNNMTNKPTWLYTTSDGGATWVSHVMPAFTGKVQMIDALNGYYVAGTIYRSKDGAKTWTAVIPVTWDGTPDFVDPNNGWIVAIKNGETALVQSVNAGVNWTILNTVIVP